jgi:hypothetical protein
MRHSSAWLVVFSEDDAERGVAEDHESENTAAPAPRHARSTTPRRLTPGPREHQSHGFFMPADGN